MTEETTYYCDATEQEIEELFEMLVVELREPRTWVSPNRGDPETFHFSKNAHSFEYDRNQNSFEAYIGETGSVAMLKEKTGAETKYHGQDTDDPAVSDLMATVEDVQS